MYCHVVCINPSQHYLRNGAVAPKSLSTDYPADSLSTMTCKYFGGFLCGFSPDFFGRNEERDRGNEARAYWSDRLTFWESVVVRRWCGAQRGRKDKWQSTNNLTCPQMSFNELPAAATLSQELIFSNDLHIPFCAQNAPHITHFS